MASSKIRGATKPSSAPATKSKGATDKVAEKASKASKKIKKIVKASTPSSSEEDDSESQEESSQGEKEADTSDSSESSESEAEAKPVVKTNGAAKADGKTNATVNGKASSVPKDDDSDDDSEEDSSESDEESVPVAKTNATSSSTIKAEESADEEDDSDESESDEEATPAVKSPAASGGLAKKAEADDSDDDSEDESDEDDKPKAKESLDGQVLPAAGEKSAQKKLTSASAPEDGESSSDDSDGSEESSSEEEEEKEKFIPPPRKRKVDDENDSFAKKPRFDEQSNPAASKNLFVGGLSWNVDDEWLKREFESFGEIVNARVITDRESGKSKGFGYVEFATADEAREAHDSMKDVEIDGRRANVDFATPRKEPGAGREQRAKSYNDQLSEPSSTLWVGNISFEANEDLVGEAFGEHGDVIGIRMPTDQDTGAPKGFAYVEFASVEHATSALNKMSGVLISGRPVRLDFAQPRAGGGGGRGRGGDRGGRGRGGFGDRGGRGGMPRGNWRGGDRGRGGARGGGRGGSSTNRGGFGEFKGNKVTF